MGFFTKRDKNGFDENGIHKDTGTAFNPDGYNRYGRDKEGYYSNGRNSLGFNKDGYNQEKFKVNEFNDDGINQFTGSSYDEEGFDENGIHVQTRQKFNESGINREGDLVRPDLWRPSKNIIVDDDVEELESPMFTEEDIQLVSQQAGVDEEKAKSALEEAKGDLARAILQLTSE